MYALLVSLSPSSQVVAFVFILDVLLKPCRPFHALKPCQGHHFRDVQKLSFQFQR
jgi:hypothetical protein